MTNAPVTTSDCVGPLFVLSNVSANPSGPEGRGLRKQAECLEGLIGFSA
jgi:hypothetical protein